MGCIFCHQIEAKHILVSSVHFNIVLDIDPIQCGHLLIIAKHHILDIRALDSAVFVDLMRVQQAIAELFEKHFMITGVSFIQNNGAVMDNDTHFHVHAIPRYNDDDFWTHQIVHQHPLHLEQLCEQLRLLQI